MQPDTPLILSLDIGSSSARAFLFSPSGEMLPDSGARQAYQPQAGEDGSVTLDPDQLVEIVCGLIDSVLSRAGGQAARIAGVAADTFVTSTIGLDASGKPLTPVLTYADSRSEVDADRLRARLDEAAFHQRTGTPFHPGYWPARLAWFARTQPGLFARVHRWVTIGEYLALRWFGQPGISNSAAGWTGLEDLRRADWDDRLLAELPAGRETLSPVIDASQPFHGLRPEFASRWPSLQKVSWLPAVGDGAASNLGSGCISAGQVAVVMGTSSAVRVALEGQVPEIPGGLWCYRIDARRPLLGGSMNEGGVIYAWAQRFLNLPASPPLEQALAALPPDGHGLTFLPLLAGERSPGWRGDARGGIYGLSLATTPLEVLRAAMEGVCYRIALIYQLVRGCLPEEPLVVASGGALQQSPLWAQILADVIDRPVVVTREAEPSARGGAILAGQVLGLLDRLEPATLESGQAFLPDPARHAVYQKALRRQQDFYRAMVAGAPAEK